MAGGMTVVTIGGTHEGHWCQEGVGDLPGGFSLVSPGWGLIVLLDLPGRCLFHVAVREGSSWSARSRVAARTNELEAGERRRNIGSGEDLVRIG